MKRQFTNVLRKNVLFKDIDFSVINPDEMQGRFISLDEGEILFKKGEEAGYTYFVVKGMIKEISPEDETEETGEKLHTENDWLGGYECLLEKQRSSTAVALANCYVIGVTRESLEEIVNRENRLYRRLTGEEKPAEDNTEETISPDTETLPDQPDDVILPDFTEEEKEDLSETPAENDFGLPDDFELDIDINEKEEEPEPEPEQENGEFSLPEDLSFVDDNEESSDEYIGSETEPEETDTEGEEPGQEKETPELPEETAAWSESTPEDTEDIEDIISAEKDSAVEQPEEDLPLETADQPDEDIPEEKEEHPDGYLADEEVLPDKPEEDYESFEPEVPDDEEEIITRPDKMESISYAVPDDLKKLNEFIARLYSPGALYNTKKEIVKTAAEVSGAEESIFFMPDENTSLLVSQASLTGDNDKVRLAPGEGLAGFSFQKGEIINIKNGDNEEDIEDAPAVSSGNTDSLLCFPLKDKSGNTKGVIQLTGADKGYFGEKDITNLELLSPHILAALEKAAGTEEFLEEEKSKYLEKLVNYLSGEVKKPALVGKRYAEHLKSHYDDEKAHRVIDMLTAQINYVVDAVQTTISSSGSEHTIRPVTAGINKFLESFTEKSAPLLEEYNCTLEKSYGDEQRVKIDTRQMQIAFSHILRNACEAKPGGKVTLKTESEGNSVVITFTDEGPGIPSEIKEGLFRPFGESDKPEGAGTGLFISRKVIEAHKGKIAINGNGNSDRGTEVRVTLPSESPV